MQQTHYDILGVQSTASRADIVRAYAARRKELERNRDQRGLQELSQSFNVLKDQARRAEYDLVIGITEREEERREREERERRERERREREDRDRQERERREREERERQLREERERREREQQAEQERQGSKNRRPRLIAVGVIAAILILAVTAGVILLILQASEGPLSASVPALIPVPTPTVAPDPTVAPVPTATATLLPTPTLTPLPTPVPSATFVPTPTSLPTATSLPPTPTAMPTPVPTATHVPTPTSPPTATPVPPMPTAMPTPTVNLAGWMTIQTLGTLKPAAEVYMAACVAGNYEKHRRRQNVPFSHDGSYGRSVSMVKVDVLVPGSVQAQHCYKLRLMYLTRELAPFCYDDPYCSSGLSGDYWETSVPVFRLMQLVSSWELP